MIQEAEEQSVPNGYFKIQRLGYQNYQHPIYYNPELIQPKVTIVKET